MSLEQKLIAGKGDFLYSQVLLKGTNISVREVLRDFSLGKTFDDILNSNPGMTTSDIQTCFEYAYELVGALELKKAMNEINRVVVKREAFISRLEEIAKNPPPLIL